MVARFFEIRAWLESFSRHFLIGEPRRIWIFPGIMGYKIDEIVHPDSIQAAKAYECTVCLSLWHEPVMSPCEHLQMPAFEVSQQT